VVALARDRLSYESTYAVAALRRQDGVGRRLSTLAVAIAAAAAMPAGCAQVPTPPKDGLISTTGPPASPIPLTPNYRGYVRIETNSRSTGCSITTELVACQRFSGNWSTTSGQRHRTVSVSADGQFHVVDADLGELQGRVPLDYRTYSAQGWTIIAGRDNTKILNDRSGHGMSINDRSATPF
jgi:hypothetical protein